MRSVEMFQNLSRRTNRPQGPLEFVCGSRKDQSIELSVERVEKHIRYVNNTTLMTFLLFQYYPISK